MNEATSGPSGLAERLAALSPQARELVLRRMRGPAGDGAAGTSPADPRPAPRTGAPLPASFAQERLWLLDRLRPDSAAYVVSTAGRLRGDLDAGRLRAGLAGLTARHEILRTSLAWTGDRTVQIVHDSVAVPWEVTDLSDAPDPRAAAERILAGDVERGFDLTAAPLWRARLVRMGPRDHLFGVAMHHTITDAWSVGVFLSELGRLYTASRDDPAPPDPVLPPLPLQYGDFAVWQRERLTDDLVSELAAFWKEELAGAPDLLALPTDRPRPQARTGRGARHEFEVPGDLLRAARDLSGSTDVTLFMALLAAFVAALSRWSGQTDLVVGTPVAGRGHPDLEGLIGFFVNSVVVRADVSDRPSFRQLLHRVRQRSLRAFEHQDLPFEKLVEHLAPTRDTAYNPLFQVNFGFGNVPQGHLDLPGTFAEPVTVPSGAGAKFDLSLYLNEHRGRLAGTFEYATDIFDAETIEGLAGYLVEVLAAVTADPDLPITQLPDPRPGQRPGTASVSAPEAGGSDAESAPSGWSTSPGFVEPRDRWERYVAQVWSEVLGVTPIGAHDEFFDLGGSSMPGMLVVDRLSKLTGRSVTLHDLYATRTVEALADWIRSSETTSADPQFVVELQPGGPRPPLFFLHAVLGELYHYFELAGALGTGRALYGVQNDGFFHGGADPGVLTMEQMADRYAEEVRRVHPEGPYHLCGFSGAGRFALAVANSLHAAGDRVGTVVLLDTAPLTDAPPDPDLAFILAGWLLFSPPEDDLRGLDRQAQLHRVLEAGKRAGDLPPEVEPAEFASFCRRLELNARAVSAYRPSYPGTVTLLTQKDRADRDLAVEWARFPIGGLKVEDIDAGSHLEFVYGPAVPEVARRLEACLDDAAPGDAGAGR
ncbi:condensation domain-containing protein [Actinomadura luteofluorescens]|uniref:condensation domain-containing protein n=1 Tax=Actinomadura luteofluorescens TaxID=46163 RepID=UPI003D91FCD1